MVDTGNDRKFEGYTSPEPFENKLTTKAVQQVKQKLETSGNYLSAPELNTTK